MRIRDIRIDGFGQFADRKFGPFDQPVTVFYGPNEAGKSTLLEFIRTVLFGFRSRAGRSSRGGGSSNYPPLAGGRHGGSLTLIDSNGRLSVVERVQGGRAGKVTIRAETGAEQDDSMLVQFLGNHSRDVFEQVFAFTLEELHSSDLLSDSNVTDQIYSVGMGVTSLPNAMNSIESERKKLFLRQGSTQKIYHAHKKFQDVDDSLREVKENATRYGERTARLQQVVSELEGLAAHRRQIQSRQDHQIRLQQGWESWNDLVSAKRELDSLPEVPNFPAGGINRLETLEERVMTAQGEHRSAQVRVEEAKRRADIRVEHEAILRQFSDIRHLQNGRTAFDQSIKDLPERKAELEGHRRTLTETLKDLGHDWDEVRLEEFEFSLAVRQEVAEHRDRLRDASADYSRCKLILDQSKVELEEAINDESKAESEFQSSAMPTFDADQIRQHRNIIRVTRSQLGELDRHRQNVSNLQSQLDGLESTALPSEGKDRSKAAAIILVLGVVFLVGAVVLGGTPLFIGAAAGIVLFGVAIYLFMSGKPGVPIPGESPIAGAIRESLRRADADMQSLQSQMARDAAPLGLDMIDESILLAAEESLDEEERGLRERDRLLKILHDAEELTKRRQIRVEESDVAVDHASQKLDSAKSEWGQWLKPRGLLDTFTPETAEVLQSQVELGRSQLETVRSWELRIKAIEKDIDEYVEAVKPLALAFDVTFDRNDWRIVATAVDNLAALHEEVKELVKKRVDAEAELEDAKDQLEERTSAQQKAEEELAQLVQSGGAESVEDFRVRAGHAERRRELDEKVRTALDRLQRLSGPGKPLESLKAELSGTDLQSITDAIATLKEEQATADAQYGELSTKRGSIQTELDSLVGEEESSRLRMERNVLVEQITGHAREWAQLTLAANLLKEARRKYERERQPGVVRHAQEFFAEITEGRYRQVYAPLGEQTITVTDDGGRTKEPSELSRGTREQLFLSLRFGLIRELGQRTEPLPVIVDEVLVNFDPDRALRAAVAFTELSCTNQILVFTCHPAVVEMFVGASSEVGIAEPTVVSIK